ncbi:MAG: hypothetical protein GY781_12680 [Gammaproteobacteria bacterium]|nr:hypothetical protein [Gammaproteobacteria bacterium]
MFKRIILVMLMLIIVACKGFETDKNSVKTIKELNNTAIGDFELLFIGNSHSSSNDLPYLVSKLIESGQPGIIANGFVAPNWGFLDELLNDGTTNKVLTNRSWTHVILQAQKYSSTGLYYYSTNAAEEWIRRIHAQNAIPIMFPEWPRRGNTEEGPRIHDLHLSIASREPACVAPIGLAWEESIARKPELILHAADGNHNNLTGALLTAYVFYEVITGQSAIDLPYKADIAVSEIEQEHLREVASYTVMSNPPCEYLTE